MTNDPLKPARDETFRKLGRNIALFQQLELGLKQLIAHSVLEGSSPEEFRERLAARQQSVRMKTLGTLVGRYTKEVLGTFSKDSQEHAVADVPAPTIRTRFRVGGEDYLQQRLETLSTLVDERNRLVHCLLEDFNLHDVDGLAGLDALLESQAERVRSQVRELNDVASTWDEKRKELARYFNSEEGQGHIDLMLLQSSRIVRMLAEICCDTVRADGWSVLPLAAGRLHKAAPDELANIRANHGHATLKSLLLATQWFELHQESTANGGTRDLFRIADEA